MPALKVTIDDKHIYRVAGEIVPGFTEIATAAGLLKYGNRDPWHMEKGAAIHRACHYVDLGQYDPAEWDERIHPQVAAYQEFMTTTGWQFSHAETPLYHPVYRYCGTPDRYLPLLDIKGAQGHRIQLEAYAELLRGNDINPGKEGFFLHLLSSGKYDLRPYKFDRTERGIWLSAVALYHYREERNLLS